MLRRSSARVRFLAALARFLLFAAMLLRRGDQGRARTSDGRTHEGRFPLKYSRYIYRDELCVLTFFHTQIKSTF